MNVIIKENAREHVSLSTSLCFHPTITFTSTDTYISNWDLIKGNNDDQEEHLSSTAAFFHQILSWQHARISRWTEYRSCCFWTTRSMKMITCICEGDLPEGFTTSVFSIIIDKHWRLRNQRLVTMDVSQRGFPRSVWAIKPEERRYQRSLS